MRRRNDALLWTVAWVLLSALAIAIADNLSLIAAIAFWLAMALILIALRPQ